MEKKLKYYGDEGYGYTKENGEFEVQVSETKTFTKLSEAKKYYESLNEEIAISDMTGLPELLEWHTFE